jgi:single-stranded DNA-binding protein
MHLKTREPSRLRQATRSFERQNSAPRKQAKPFVTATIRVKDGEAAQWWKVLAFSETVQSELMRLTDGDALSVQGALKAETYEKDGASRLSLSVVADQVLALRQPRRAKKANPETDARRVIRHPWLTESKRASDIAIRMSTSKSRSRRSRQ